MLYKILYLYKRDIYNISLYTSVNLISDVLKKLSLLIIRLNYINNCVCEIGVSFHVSILNIENSNIIFNNYI